MDVKRGFNYIYFHTYLSGSYPEVIFLPVGHLFNYKTGFQDLKKALLIFSLLTCHIAYYTVGTTLVTTKWELCKC